ncbi:MAG: hypothetical protein U1E39_14370 [Planctomycetota bacterium]
MNDKILDLVLGQLPPGGAEAQGIDADPAARAERDRWARWASAAKAAHELSLDPAAGQRIAARVVARVREEEARAARPAARRSFWGRVLAASLAAHAVFLGVFALRAHRAETTPVEPFLLSPRWDVAAGDPAGAEERGLLPLPEAPSFDGAMASERDLVPSDLPDEAPFPSPAATAVGPHAIGLRAASPAFRARTSDPVKRAIEARLSARGSLDTIRRSLEALARTQRPDGSFAAPAGTDVSDATALTVLPFLGDGSSSRFGAHREVVAKAVAFLRSRHDAATGTVAGGDAVLWALAEDQWLAGGFRTPAENRAPAADLRALASRLAADGAAPAPDSLRAVAFAAAARARVVDAAPVATLASATVADWLAADVRPETALTRGAALASGAPVETFRRFSVRAAATLRTLVGEDGLVTDTSLDPAARALATARAVLALQVPFRAE